VTAPGPQPAPVSPGLECTVCASGVTSPHGAGAVTPGQADDEFGDNVAAARKLEFDNWFGGQGYDDDGRFDSEEMEFAFESGMIAQAALAAQGPHAADEAENIGCLIAALRDIRDANPDAPAGGFAIERARIALKLAGLDT